jgi:hypothetical protein
VLFFVGLLESGPLATSVPAEVKVTSSCEAPADATLTCWCEALPFAACGAIPDKRRVCPGQ